MPWKTCGAKPGTVVAPTILVEPEKTEESTTEGEVPAEGEEGATVSEEGKEKIDKPADDKTKVASGDKAKTSPV